VVFYGPRSPSTPIPKMTLLGLGRDGKKKTFNSVVEDPGLVRR